MVTDEQVTLLRRKRRAGLRQEAAAAAAGMGVRTARRWEEGPMPSEKLRERTWRTRLDPFVEVWESELVPLLERDEEGVLEATTLLDELEERYPGRYSSGQLRTLQRRVRDWRALYGPPKEVFFPQEHPPGREAALDFSHAKRLGVMIAGEAFPHLVFQLKLSCSGWTWPSVVPGETFEALVKGMQEAFWELGGVTEVVRHDNLSAATHELRRTGGRALTSRFRDVLDHYGLRSTRIRPGESHENGVAEKSHDLLKSRLAQALVLRGSRDFESVEAYECWVREVCDRTQNRPRAEAIAEEKQHLRPLPACRMPDDTVHRPTVRRWSTIRVGKRIYSVPSRLIGHRLEVRLGPDALEVRYKGSVVERLPRLHGDADVRVDYRHVIWSLVRKPGAFARYRYREELFPTLAFRKAYDALADWRGERTEIEYVRILHLAASTMQSTVERALETLLDAGEPFDYAMVRALAQPEPVTVPEVRLPAPDLAAYDELLEAAR